VYVYDRDSLGVWSNTPAYIKATNSENDDSFGASLSLSDNGNILAIGDLREDSAASGINGRQTEDCGASDNCASDSGAVFIYTRDANGSWNDTPVYIKATNTEAIDKFGLSVSLTSDGDALAVGAPGEDNASTSINGIPTEDCSSQLGYNCATDSGAVYLY
jgi:hypothetical protein